MKAPDKPGIPTVHGSVDVPLFEQAKGQAEAGQTSHGCGREVSEIIKVAVRVYKVGQAQSQHQSGQLTASDDEPLAQSQVFVRKHAVREGYAGQFPCQCARHVDATAATACGVDDGKATIAPRRPTACRA